MSIDFASHRYNSAAATAQPVIFVVATEQKVRLMVLFVQQLNS